VRLELLPPPSPPRARERRERRFGALAAVALFALTLLSTVTLGGAWSLLARSDVAPGVVPILTPATVALVWGDAALRAQGFAFALPALFILLCHEVGHWLACRHHGLPTSPPVFLPAPLGLGTFGAFIHLRRPFRSRRELLDVGVWGPLAGFGALLPFLVIGAALSQPSAPAETLAAVGAPPRLRLGGNLLLAGVQRLVHGELPPGVVLNPHPFLLAAWVGCCATMLNLLPLGRLDGGHVVYAAGGAWQRRAAWPLWAALVLLGARWPWWWLWSVVILLLGLHHPRVDDEQQALDSPRRALAFAALALFALTFMPVPLRVEAARAAAPASRSPFGQVEDEGDRTVVHQLDRHPRAEAAAGDAAAARAQPLGEPVDERRRDRGRRGAREGGAAPPVERGEEGELGDEQDLAAGRREVEVHPAAGVVEDPERGELGGGGLDLGLAVAVADPGQDEQPATDRGHLLRPDRDAGARDALQDETHRFRLLMGVLRGGSARIGEPL
jgi:hypothetical protein